MLTQVLLERLSRHVKPEMVIQNVLASRVDLVPAPQTNVLKVLVHIDGDSQYYPAIAHLCSQLNPTETMFPGTNLRLIYEPLLSCSEKQA
jgi:hypothetical protein